MTTKKSIILEYGDIIQLKSDTDESIHDKIYLIEYIDETIIELLSNDEDRLTLEIEEGMICEDSITTIIILSKSKEKGYARQNNLLPKKWVQIHFGGDVPTILVGQIINLEEDQIEIKVFPSDDIIYIDFGYKGIPKDIPIEKIQLREKPLTEEIETETQEQPIPSEKIDIETDDVDVIDDEEEIPLRAKIQGILEQSTDFFISDDAEEIQQEVRVSDDEKRFSIDEQVNDLLDEMLTKIPTQERNTKTMNKLHRIIERFSRLRQDFSIRDKNNVDLHILKRGKNYKPLLKNIYNLENIPSWIVPIVKNKKKIYLQDKEEQHDYFEDIQSQKLSNIRTNETQLINSYYRNENPSGINKYDYLHKNLNTYFIPHTLPHETNDIIILKKTKDNIETMANNTDGYLREIFSSVIKNNQLTKQRFVINKYNLGTSRLQHLQSGRQGFQLSLQFSGNNTRKQITENEEVPIESLLFLDKPFIEYSQSKLPRTKIIHRTQLNLYPLLKSYSLSHKTSLNNILIEKYKNEESDLTDLFHSKTHIKLAPGLLEDTSYVKKYGKDKFYHFLETILPTNKTIIDKFIKTISENGKHLSMHDILKDLEPFHIDIDNIHIHDYKTIVSLIERNIKNNKTSLINKLQDIERLLKIKLRNEYTNSYIYNLVKNIEDIKLYQERENAFHGEHIQSWMLNDYGCYIYSILVGDNVSLYNNENIDNELLEQLERIENEMNNRENKCINYVLSKKYNSLDELENDNNVNIYYDEKYDITDYEYLKQFEEQYNEIEYEEFKDLVIENIMYDKNMNYETAEIEYTNMMNGQRKVEEGVYAILVNNQDEESDVPSVYYYKRNNNVWVLDSSIDNKNYDSSKMFCNVKKKCIQMKTLEDCNEIDIEKKNLEYAKLSSSIKDLSDDFIKKQREYIENTQERINRLKSILLQSIKLRNTLYMSSNKYLYHLGTLLDDLDIVVSPYEKLRDLILSQPDFVTKMTNIRKFIELNYVRNANTENEESPFWLYCTETNIKLLPSFLKDLAEAFLIHDNYTQELNRICAERGEISDDGDKWVDKYSGYTIRLIDFDTEEGFDTQGFRIQTREVMREDEDILVGEVTNEDKLINSPDGIIVRKIIISLSQHIGVNLSNQLDFIIKNTLVYAYRSIGNKDVYDRRKQKLEEKTGKTMINYEDKKGELIMLFVSFFFLLSIQTHIPSIKTKKTFPGCVRSFDGFPMDSENEKGIDYIICVVKKLVSNEYPWNTIKRFKEDIIKKNITTLYNKLLVKDSVIQTLIQDKIQYLKEKDDSESEEITDVTQWNNFMPPLQEFSVSKIITIGDNFENRLRKNIVDGSKKQDGKINTLKSKINMLSLSILKHIRNIVKDEKLILHSSGQFYKENSCCEIDIDDRKYSNVLKYFVKKNKDISRNMKLIHSLYNLYSDFSALNIPYTFINTDNTRQHSEETRITQHDEQTIYLAFIKYCKYNKNIPVDSRLLEVCVRNTSSFSLLDSVEEKIAIMKDEGMEYTPEMFYSMLNIINKNNIIENKYYSLREISLLYSLQKYLDELDFQDNSLYMPIQKYLNKIMGTFRYANEDVEEEIDRTSDIMQQDIKKVDKNMNKMRNYILKNIERDRSKLKDYISQYSNAKKNIKNKINSYLDTFIEFESIDTTEYRNNNDNTIIKARNFIQNMVHQITYDYPNIILNNIRYDDSIDIPSHWNLSQFHNQDIKNFIQKSYSYLEPFIDEEILKPILRNIRKRVDVVINITKMIPHMNLLQKGDKMVTPVFNHTFIKEIYEFLYLRIFVEYIDIIEQYSDLSRMEKELESVVVSREERDEEEEEDDEIIDNNLLQADKLKLKRRVGDLLTAYLRMSIDQKKRINMNKQTITELTLRSREKEKDIKTTKLKELTPEERNVDNVLKAAKMGRWNIGLQKGLTQYVQETYDMERSSDEYREIVNLELQFMGENVVPQNENIIRDELMEQQMSEHLIDMEANDMSHIPDDDDFGDMDGDEHFY